MANTFGDLKPVPIPSDCPENKVPASCPYTGPISDLHNSVDKLTRILLGEESVGAGLLMSFKELCTTMNQLSSSVDKLHQRIEKLEISQEGQIKDTLEEFRAELVKAEDRRIKDKAEIVAEIALLKTATNKQSTNWFAVKFTADVFLKLIGAVSTFVGIAWGVSKLLGN